MEESDPILPNELPVPDSRARATGPKSSAGRAVSRRNATSHGISSCEPVIPEMESAEEWERHRDGILAGLDPEGDLEEVLAERVALLLWRLRRVTRYEVAATLQNVESAERDLQIADAYGQGTIARGIFPEIAPARVARARETRILPVEDRLNLIMRYESHLHRQCIQTLHELEALQARRRGEQTHLARLDISSPPGAWLAAARR